MYMYFYETEIGTIGIAEKNGRITNLYFPNDNLPRDIEIQETSVLKKAVQQLNSYLAGNLKMFSLPLEPTGTVFMRQIWATLTQIPYAKTVRL